jgi:hypothetical protein
MKMKRYIQALLLAGVACSTVATTAQAASGDLIAGFDQGSGNTFVFNLGQFSSLFSGEQWHLGTQLTGAGFNPVTPGSGINFGVIGYNTTGSTLYSTVSAADPTSDFNGAKTVVNTLNTQNHVQAVGSGVDWFTETENQFAFGNWVGSTLNLPNATQPGSATLNSLSVDTGASSSYLDFNLTWDGTLIYGVPEPTTAGLFAGLGVLVLVLRRRFTRV